MTSSFGMQPEVPLSGLNTCFEAQKCPLPLSNPPFSYLQPLVQHSVQKVYVLEICFAAINNKVLQSKVQEGAARGAGATQRLTNVTYPVQLDEGGASGAAAGPCLCGCRKRRWLPFQRNSYRALPGQATITTKRKKDKTFGKFCYFFERLHTCRDQSWKSTSAVFLLCHCRLFPIRHRPG